MRRGWTHGNRSSLQDKEDIRDGCIAEEQYLEYTFDRSRSTQTHLRPRHNRIYNKQNQESTQRWAGRVLKRTPPHSILHQCNNSQWASNKSTTHNRCSQFGNTRWKNSSILLDSSLSIYRKDQGQIESSESRADPPAGEQQTPSVGQQLCEMIPILSIPHQTRSS